MAMNVNGYGSSAVEQSVYAAKEAAEANQAAKAEKQAEKTEEKKTDKTAAEKKAEETGVVYEKSEDGAKDKKATYSINKMSADDRAALVKQLKADQESRKQSLINLVHSMMGKQAGTFATANGDDSMWKFLASGKYTVSAEAKLQAQKDIAEDGYWGVKQTSQRLFDFASALAGDDVDKMKQMQAAMEKGFKLATKSWGKELPKICHETLSAANKLFDDYYSSKAKDKENTTAADVAAAN